MKAEHRKELETNILADKMGKIITASKSGPTRGMMFYVMVAVAAVLVVFLGYRWVVTGRTSSSAGWYRLEDGSSQVITELANSKSNDNPAKVARFQIAYERLWLYGIKLLGFRPNEALSAIQKAEEEYLNLAKDCKGDPVFEPEALYALAVIEETRAIFSRKSLEDAVEKYKAVGKSNKESAFAQLAKQRIEDLENDKKNFEIKQFYQKLDDNLKQGQMRPVMPRFDELMLKKN